MAHGFTTRAEKNVLSGKARRCLLNYNSKGVQTERIISPIQIKQLFVPFAILFTGFALATMAFIFELIIYKRSTRQTTVVISIARPLKTIGTIKRAKINLKSLLLKPRSKQTKVKMTTKKI